MAGNNECYANVCNVYEDGAAIDEGRSAGETFHQHYKGGPPLPKPRPVSPPSRYETTCHTRQSPYPVISTKSHTTTQDNGNVAKSNRNGIPNKFMIIGMCILVLLLVALVVETSILLKNQQNLMSRPGDTVSTSSFSPTGPMSTSKPVAPTSCLEQQRWEPESRSGIYTLATKMDHSYYDVYCDMDTDGGGWTLVASVHEDNITNKCDNNDRWSTHDTGDSAWQDRKTFGDTQKATYDDYKNPGYYELEAKDVMIWHVPANTPIEVTREKATIRYRTSNNFLSHFGGSIYSLFVSSYELEIKEYYMDIADLATIKRTTKFIDAVTIDNSTIRSHVPDWHSYEMNYDSSPDELLFDYDMYDYWGNHVFLGTPDEAEWMEYDREYWWGQQNTFSTISKRSSPFVMAGVVDNKWEGFLQIRVQSLHKDLLSFTEENNTVVLGNFKIMYRSIQFKAKAFSTACQFHFAISSIKDWRSHDLDSFNLDISNIDDDSRYIISLIEGPPSNFIFGYILLARENELPITRDMQDNVAAAIISSVKDLDIFNEYGGSDGLVVPVTFDKGDEDTLMNMVPEVLRSKVEAGYLQLRAFNQAGYPNALCPGVRLDTYFAEYVCIGGISNDMSRTGTCGDFAGWGGKETSGYGHSDEDINTPILIFYR